MTSSLRELASELRADILSTKTVPALSAGFTSGLGLLVAQVAFGSFIFSGPLASHSSQGVGPVLFGNFAACLLVALASSYRGAIAGLSPALVIVMATVASLIVPASLRSKLFRATTRLTGVAAALVIGCALFLGDGMLELVPVSLVGGILFFAGLGMLDEGLVRSRRRLPWSEYGIIVLIFVVIIAFGLFEGVGAGMLATLVFFAVRLSRVDPIESRFTGRERRSTKSRPVPDRAILLEEGERVVAYRLRGYIFFGSAGPLADHLKKSLGGASRPACLMLDFSAVSGFDFSAVNVLARFLRSANGAGVQVVLSAVSEQLRVGLERNLPPSDFSVLRIETNADRALEVGEEIVIAAWRTDAAATDGRRAALLEHAAADLERHLDRQIQFEDLVKELRDWLESREYSADEPCETMVLTPAARRWLEEHEEQLALKLYRYLLAGRFEAEPAAS